MVRLSDCPDMTIAVYCGCKATIQQQQQKQKCTIIGFQRSSANKVGLSVFMYRLNLIV